MPGGLWDLEGHSGFGFSEHVIVHLSVECLLGAHCLKGHALCVHAHPRPRTISHTDCQDTVHWGVLPSPIIVSGPIVNQKTTLYPGESPQEWTLCVLNDCQPGQAERGYPSSHMPLPLH